MRLKASSSSVSFPVWIFTQAGNELYNMVDLDKSNIDYLREVIEKIKGMHSPNVNFFFVNRDKVPSKFVSDLNAL